MGSRRRSAEELKARMIDAGVRGSTWLADGNEAAERGDKKRAHACYEKSQFWLDRYNSLSDKMWLAKRQ